MSQKSPVIRFNLIKSASFTKEFIEYYDENRVIRYFLQVRLEYPERLQWFHNLISIPPEKVKTDEHEKKQSANLMIKKII